MYFKLFSLFSAHSVNVIEKHPNMRSIESTNKKNHIWGIVDVCCFQGIEVLHMCLLDHIMILHVYVKFLVW